MLFYYNTHIYIHLKLCFSFTVEILQCMHVWEEDEMSYVITQKPVNNDNSVALKKSAECLVSYSNTY